MELECHEKILIRFGRWFWFELKKYDDMEKTKFQLLWKIKVLFEFVVSIIDNSVFITYNSKMVGPMAEKSVWIFITLFLVFVSMTQLSDFWVMSYGNWKYIWRRKKKKRVKSCGWPWLVDSSMYGLIIKMSWETELWKLKTHFKYFQFS